MISVNVIGPLPGNVAVDVLGYKLRKVFSVLKLKHTKKSKNQIQLSTSSIQSSYNVIHRLLPDNLVHVLVAVDLE